MMVKRSSIFILLLSSILLAAGENPTVEPDNSTSGSIWGDTGPFSFEFGLTNIYQQNLRGGLSTHKRDGRYTGSYDVVMTTDLKRLFGVDGALLFTHVEGLWPNTEGIDPGSVASYFGVNRDTGQSEAVFVSELWYEQSLLDDNLVVRLGKMDITGGFECSGCPVSFDCNRYANDETQQFLNSALVTNPTIPFPAYALGIAAHYLPAENWYVSAAATDGAGVATQSGFNTAFETTDTIFYTAETGITPQFNSARGPLQGAYRIGTWYTPQMPDDDTIQDNTGMYASFDQLLIKENDGDEDSQGLGTFCRLGYAQAAKNDMNQFYSAGLSYQGLIDGRNDDVLAFGIARGYFSNHAAADYPNDSETVYELFYNAQISNYMTLTPSLQYIASPAEGGRKPDAMVLGLRAQLVF